MTSMTDAPPSPVAWQDDAILWQHSAFCGLALPLRVPRDGLWSRGADGTTITLGAEDAAGTEPAKLPAGRLLRLLLLHVFTLALRKDSPSVEIGPDPASVAASLGLDVTPPLLAELGEQAERLVAARLRVATGGKSAALSVLDARRSGAPGSPRAWRPVLRLTDRFFASLRQGAVALDRGTVTALAGSAPALDAYAWLAATLPAPGADQPVLHSWAEMQQRFGSGGADDGAAFRTAFTETLELVRGAWTAGRFTVGQDGVELRGIAAPDAPNASPAAPPEPAPAAAPPPPLPPSSPAAAVVPPSPPIGTAAERDGPAAPVSARPDQAGLAAVRPGPVPAKSGRAEAGQAEPGRPEPARAEPARPEPTRMEPARIEPSRTEPGRVEPGQANRPRGPEPRFERERTDGRIRLAPKLTGLDLSVWLRRSNGMGDAIIEVTPGPDYNPARRSLFILEPVILQVDGTLRPREMEQVAAWVTANAELIQDYWSSPVMSVHDVAGRVKALPTQRW